MVVAEPHHDINLLLGLWRVEAIITDVVVVKAEDISATGGVKEIHGNMTHYDKHTKRNNNQYNNTYCWIDRIYSKQFYLNTPEGEGRLTKSNNPDTLKLHA